MGGTVGARRPIARVLREIEKAGLLLASDPELPSVTALVVGAPVRGSWWAHPRAREIYAVLTELEEHPRLLLVKLVSKKQTFVHRALWPALLAVTTCGEPWQTSGLGPMDRSLLGEVEGTGRLRLDRIVGAPDAKARRSSARRLEERLLVYGEQIHTESGAHEKVLVSWKTLARERNVTWSRLDSGRARAALASRSPGKLPWQ